MFSENIETNIGVPQGSNLGPLLFLVFFNDLPISMNGEIDCYADDTTISTTNKNIQKIEEKLDSIVTCSVIGWPEINSNLMLPRPTLWLWVHQQSYSEFKT